MKRIRWGWAAAGAATTLVVLVVGFLGMSYAGGYNVSAANPDPSIMQWALSTTMDHSVRAHARAVGPAPDLTDPELLSEGFEHYDAMCVTCHGAPGVERGEVGEGMTPEPPKLTDAADEWSDQELFWIVKNGIKMAGMPGFGVTHTDEQVWGMVGAMRQMTRMTPEQYAQTVAQVSGGDDHDEHGHEAHEHEEMAAPAPHVDPPGTPPHTH